MDLRRVVDGGSDYGHDRTESEWNLPTARDAKVRQRALARACVLSVDIGRWAAGRDRIAPLWKLAVSTAAHCRWFTR